MTAALSGVESSPSSASISASRSRPARRSTALTKPAACGGPGPLDQLDRLVDRGVVGRAVGEEELVEAEAQAGQHRRVELAQRAVDEPLERRVDRAAPLHGAVGEPLRLGALAAVELGAVRRLAEGALGVRFVLEGRPDRLEGELRGPVRSQLRQRVAAQVGVGGHRLAARRLHDLEPQGAATAAEQQRPPLGLDLAGLTPTSTARARRTPRRSPSAVSR